MSFKWLGVTLNPNISNGLKSLFWKCDIPPFYCNIFLKLLNRLKKGFNLNQSFWSLKTLFKDMGHPKTSNSKRWNSIWESWECLVLT